MGTALNPDSPFARALPRRTIDFLPYLCSIIGGILMACAFPRLSWTGLAWIAPGIILFSALGHTPGAAFRIGYCGGLAHYLFSLSWLLRIPFPAGAISGWFALSCYLALFTGSWVWLSWRTFELIFYPIGIKSGMAQDPFLASNPNQISPVRGPIQFPKTSSFRESVAILLQTPLPARILWALFTAILWVALEMILARLFTGFPWNLFGVCQYQILPLIQIARFTGVYGVSFLLVWFSISLALATLRLISFPTLSRAWLTDLAIPLIVVVATVTYGASRLVHPLSSPRTLSAVLLQPSIPQTLIWDTNQNAMRFSQLTQLSNQALQKETNAQLLVWPEAAVPNMLRYDHDIYSTVTNLTISHRVWMILGSDDADPRPGTLDREYDFFNSSFLIDPGGHLSNRYQKRRLVIFGEYIPLERWLPFMKYLTPVGGSFTPGQGPIPFRLGDVQAKTSVLICFEDVFPHIAREYVQEDTDFLVNLTNNGWFGEAAAQWQHAANAAFRSVENGTPLVRCANNGLTCVVDERGGMHDIFYSDHGGIYGPGYKTVQIPLLGHGEKRKLTFYTRYGDVFGWSCVVVTGLVLFLLRRQRNLCAAPNT